MPAYGYMYFATAARLAGAAVDLAPEADLIVDTAALAAQVRPATRVVFVANPGNPTGTRIGRADLVALRDRLPADVLLVIDEAYAEFAPPAPVFDLVARGNTVVLRSFSKAYGLAGLRVGWGLFPEAVAAEVQKTMPPNGVAAPAQAAAAAAMRDTAWMRASVATIGARRDRFAARLRAAGLAVPDSHTNFVLIGFASAAAAAAADAALRRDGLVLRGMAGYGLPDRLRATIGSAEAMDRAAAILEAGAR
jgi:histidinol-phosphate/aromatic aminotransferase/cobyric acid decarboxylase-like protein